MCCISGTVRKQRYWGGCLNLEKLFSHQTKYSVFSARQNVPQDRCKQVLGAFRSEKIAWDDKGRLHEEAGGFLLHFDENGKGVPVM